MADRKAKGQVFTPLEVCDFMAGLFPSFPKRFRLLDPGAGIGALAAAVCERILHLHSPREVEIHLFENDREVLPALTKTMKHCCKALQIAGHRATYHVHERDFILDVADGVFGQQRSLFNGDDTLGRFDGVIMNPPYFKVTKDSPYARVMQEVVHGQPNIYAFFMALAAQLLRPGGYLVSITPRSFCNGLYFRGFRRWFLARMALDHIHLFDSRTDTFRGVLQESVITAAHRLGKPSATVAVTTSHGGNLRASTQPRMLPTSAVVDDTCGECLIRIPTSQVDLEILNTLESWPQQFKQLGLRVSTGPVVTFRARQYLLPEPNGSKTAPLFNPVNVRPFQTLWPPPHRRHPSGFRVCPDSMRLLLPTRNYVLLRRFTTKEERRRLVASHLLAANVKWPYVALENHLNYVYHAERELTEDETLGLTAVFNSALLDRYFRTINGNTQVNAT